MYPSLSLYIYTYIYIMYIQDLHAAVADGPSARSWTGSLPPVVSKLEE